MTHSLKIWPQYYYPVSVGLKTFEVRKNDRGFQAGDIVLLKEYEPDSGVFTASPVLAFKIGYILPIDAERVVFSLLPLEPK